MHSALVTYIVNNILHMSLPIAYMDTYILLHHLYIYEL